MYRFGFVSLFIVIIAISTYLLLGISSDSAQNLATNHSLTFINKQFGIDEKMKIIENELTLLPGRRVTLGINNKTPIAVYYISGSGEIKQIDIIEKSIGYDSHTKVEVYEFVK